MTQYPDDDLDAVFANASGGGGNVPSFDWQKAPKVMNGKDGYLPGDEIRGVVTGLFRTNVKMDGPNGTRVDKLDKNGNTLPQINITLETEHRGWQRVTNIPTGEDGQTPLPASEDEGKRRVYAKYRMLVAVAEAVAKATGRPGAPKIGGKLAIRVKGNVDTGARNLLPDYEALYVPPSEFDGVFADAAAQTPAAAATPAPTPAPAPAAPAVAVPPAEDAWANTGVGAPSGW